MRLQQQEGASPAHLTVRWPHCLQGWAWEPEPVGMAADARDAVPWPLLGVDEQYPRRGAAGGCGLPECSMATPYAASSG